MSRRGSGGSHAGGRSAEGRDADAGRGGGDGAAARVGMGREADRGRARLQPEHGEALSRAWRLDAATAGRQRTKALDGLADWLAERFRQHRGNADVVRQELRRERGIAVSLRTVERAVAPLRRELRPRRGRRCGSRRRPAEQLQIDFGETRWRSAARRSGSTCSWRRSATRAACMCARSGTSARRLVRRAGGRLPGTSAGCRTRCCSTTPGRWSCTMTGRPARSLQRPLPAFASYWRFRPRACAPYRARTKGKDERGVGYVKSNAIAGRQLRELGGVRGAPGAAGCARSPTCGSMAPPASRRSTASSATKRCAAAARRPAAVPAGPRADPPGSGGLLRRDRRQRLQRAVAAGRRGRDGRVGGGRLRVLHAGRESRACTRSAAGAGSGCSIRATSSRDRRRPAAGRSALRRGGDRCPRRRRRRCCVRWPNTRRRVGGGWS